MQIVIAGAARQQGQRHPGFSIEEPEFKPIQKRKREILFFQGEKPGKFVRFFEHGGEIQQGMGGDSTQTGGGSPDTEAQKLGDRFSGRFGTPHIGPFGPDLNLPLPAIGAYGPRFVIAGYLYDTLEGVQPA